MSSPSSAASGDILKQGYLEKLGGKIQTWKKRYMVLRGGELLYYKSHDVSGKAKGSIVVDGATLSTIPDNNPYGAGRHHLFGLTPMNGQRMYVMQAMNDLERAEWSKACCAAGAMSVASKNNSKTQVNSLLEGYLDKNTTGRFFTQQKQRFYFVLLDDKLSYWKTNQTGDTPLDSVSISVDSIVQPGTAGSNSLKFVSKKGAEKWLLTADKHAICDEWIKALRCLIRCEQFTPSSSDEPLTLRQSVSEQFAPFSPSAPMVRSDDSDDDVIEEGDEEAAIVDERYDTASIEEAYEFDDDIPPPPDEEDGDMVPPPPPDDFDFEAPTIMRSGSIISAPAGFSPSAVKQLSAPNALLASNNDALTALRNLYSQHFAFNPSLFQQYLTTFITTQLDPASSSDHCEWKWTRGVKLEDGRKIRLKASASSSVSSPSDEKEKEDECSRMLHIHLLEMANLPAMDANGFSDPYAILFVRSKEEKKTGHKLKSRTMDETCNPVYDQHMTIDAPNWAEELVIDVYDHDKFSTDDFIGRAVFPLARLQLHGAALRGWFPLVDSKGDAVGQGSVFVSIVADQMYVESGKRSTSTFQQQRKRLLQAQEEKYITEPEYEKIKIFMATWNAGNAPPPNDLSNLIPIGQADIYVIGTQECKYVARGDYGSCKVDWMAALVRHFGREYSLVKYHSLWEIRIAVFALNKHVSRITNLQSYEEATGIGNILGNKGGVVVSFNIHHTSLCFVSSHLAAHQQYCDLRNANYRNIIKNIKAGAARDSDILNLHHHIFWMGDLNYRIDYGDQGDAKSPSEALFNEMVNKIHEGTDKGWEELIAKDQLRREMREQRVFVGFQEGNYYFPPTFKVHRSPQLLYNPQRSPAYCDRILWRSVPGYPITQLSLNAATSVATSDHKPVTSIFEVDTLIAPLPIDRNMGTCIVRVHDVRANNLRIPREKFDKNENLSLDVTRVDPCVTFNASFLSKPIVSSILRKSINPSWPDLPPAQSSVNHLPRLRVCTMAIRVDNRQGQDTVIGRAQISLTELEWIDVTNVEGISKQCTKTFNVELTYGGLGAGTIEGQIDFMWKPPEKKKKR